jgi:hypothetical protein
MSVEKVSWKITGCCRSFFVLPDHSSGLVVEVAPDDVEM